MYNNYVYVAKCVFVAKYFYINSLAMIINYALASPNVWEGKKVTREINIEEMSQIENKSV